MTWVKVFISLFLYLLLDYLTISRMAGLSQDNNLKMLRKGRGYVLTLILLMWRIGWAPNSIPIYIQQDVKLHSLFISGNCSTCFGWYFHPSSGAHTTLSTAPGICHTVMCTTVTILCVLQSQFYVYCSHNFMCTAVKILCVLKSQFMCTAVTILCVLQS
jgi:hypothetical protein